MDLLVQCSLIQVYSISKVYRLLGLFCNDLLEPFPWAEILTAVKDQYIKSQACIIMKSLG